MGTPQDSAAYAGKTKATQEAMGGHRETYYSERTIPGMFHVKHSDPLARTHEREPSVKRAAQPGQFAAQGFSSFTLKIAAISGMTCCHVANVFCPLMPNALAIVLYALGGMTFPIMCYLLVQGYSHSSNLRKYALRLGVFAVVAQIPYSLLWGMTPNVLFTLLACLGILWAYDNIRPRWAFWLIALAAYAGTAAFDWGGIGIAMALLFHMLRDQPRSALLVMLIPFVATAFGPIQSLSEMAESGLPVLSELTAVFDLNPETAPLFFSYTDPGNLILQSGFYVANFAILGYATIGFGLAALFISLYDGRRGRPAKFFFYAFYPAHLAVIWLLTLIL